MNEIFLKYFQIKQWHNLENYEQCDWENNHDPCYMLNLNPSVLLISEAQE